VTTGALSAVILGPIFGVIGLVLAVVSVWYCFCRGGTSAAAQAAQPVYMQSAAEPVRYVQRPVEPARYVERSNDLVRNTVKL